MVQLSNRQEIDGLEVDQAVSGLQVVSNTQDVELVPAESLAKIGLQTLPGVEKELSNISENRSNESSSDGRSRHVPPATLRSRLLRYLLAGVILVIIIVAIAAPLGVRTKRSERNKASSSTLGSSADHPPTLPTQNDSGVIDGTNISLNMYADSQITEADLFYQDSQSWLRQFKQIKSSRNTTSSVLPIIALDAREGTPIANIKYTSEDSDDGVSFWRNQK
ncbi:MAG: hypothetical protein Q9201_005618 [Fulgogasparrea decipioides]